MDDFDTRWYDGVPVTTCTRCGEYVWDAARHEAHAHSVPATPITITWVAAAGVGQPQ
jgi:hypothetical protein